MKGSMKKLAVFVVITVIAPFIMADIASPWQHAIRGKYAYTGETTCLISPSGFTDKLQPIAGWGIIQTSSREGVFRFEHDGTGSAYMFSRNITLPYQKPAPVPDPFGASTMDITFHFTYTLEKDGTIKIMTETEGEGVFTSKVIAGPDEGLTLTITGVLPNGSITPIVSDGVTTPDSKTITLNAGAPDVYQITRPDGMKLKSICRSSGVLIWQHK
jgi:hypothetical protein